MKKFLSRLFTILFLVIISFHAILARNYNTISTIDEEEDIRLLYVEKTVDFILTKENKINLKLKVLEKVAPKEKGVTYSKAIFFNGSAELKTIRAKNKRITPAISDYETDGIFHNDVKIALFKYDFVKSSSPIDISYEKVFYDYKFMELLYFIDYRYEIDESKIIINIPEWLECRMEEFNFDGYEIKKDEQKANGMRVLEYTSKSLKIPSRENGAPARGKIYPHLMLIPESYTVGNKKKTLMPSVKELYGWYHELASSVKNNVSPLKEKVNELTTGKTDDLEKIKSVFYWVQDNIRYIAFEQGIMGFKPDACQNVYNNKYGDCKGMANLAKEMLQLAGYDARLTWLGTNDVPYDYSYPTLYADNHMICTVILDGEKIFLDPTEKYANLYNYAYRIQGREVLIENGKDYMIEKIPLLDARHNEQKKVSSYHIKDDVLIGESTLVLKGNSKTTFYNQISSISGTKKELWLKAYLENADKNVKAGFEALPDVSDRDKDLTVKYTFEAKNHIIDLGKEKYINPELDSEFADFLIPEDRVLPYEFQNRYFINSISQINLPPNWKSNYIPESISIKNDNFSFDLQYKLNGNSIEYSKQIIIEDKSIDPDEFKAWNESIKSLSAFYKDQLIFVVE